MEDLVQLEPQVARGRFREELWTDPNWVAEEKFDGERFKMHIGPTGNRFDSRRISKETGRYKERTDNVPHLRDFPIPQLAGTILDGEMQLGLDVMSTASIMGSSPAVAVAKQEAAGTWVTYNVFDVPVYRGEDITDRSYSVRRKLLEEIHKLFLVKNTWIVLTRVEGISKEDYCNAIWDAGREGVILKNIHAPYTDKTAWVKVKMQNTYDVVIMGYKPAKELSLKKGDAEATATKFAANNWIGAIIFGQYINGELAILGNTSGMPDNIRLEVSEHKKKYIGRVITIEAQTRIEKTGRFRHPRFLRFREDKAATDCIYDENER